MPSSLGVTSTSGSSISGVPAASWPSWELSGWLSSGSVSTREPPCWGPATAQLTTNPAKPRTTPTVKAEAIHKKTFSPRDIFFRGGLAGCPAGWPYQGWPGWGWYQPWG